MKSYFLKTIIFLSLIIASTTNNYAQVKIGSSIRLAVPFGQYKDFGSIGVGNAPTMKIFFNPHFALSLNVGWINFFLDQKPNLSRQWFFAFPLVGGPQFYFTKKGFRPFIGYNVGATINHYRFDSKVNGVKDKHRTTDTYFSMAPEVGFLIDVSNKIDIHANARYNIQYVPRNSALNFQDKKTTFEFFEVQVGLLITVGGKEDKKKEEEEKKEKEEEK